MPVAPLFRHDSDLLATVIRLRVDAYCCHQNPSQLNAEPI